MGNAESKICVICHEETNSKSMISPCDCSGSVKWYHSECLNNHHYVNTKKCKMCNYEYNKKKVFSWNLFFTNILDDFLWDGLLIFYCWIIYYVFFNDFLMFVTSLIIIYVLDFYDLQIPQNGKAKIVKTIVIFTLYQIIRMDGKNKPDLFFPTFLCSLFLSSIKFFYILINLENRKLHLFPFIFIFFYLFTQIESFISYYLFSNITYTKALSIFVLNLLSIIMDDNNNVNISEILKNIGIAVFIFFLINCIFWLVTNRRIFLFLGPFRLPYANDFNYLMGFFTLCVILAEIITNIIKLKDNFNNDIFRKVKIVSKK